ncbi:MAG: EamA family transporter [Hamadaea sp.]|uniref:DMT family transporter n=1 Tax=Hamadaea sp. TaxID=2024425 RepID=UPI001816C61F|nr:EamA family transporter [Hamadaea sp.]NUR70443.1 EamA family transporter [Hamadaea sp.]NUT20033.1 EamA family transporter [Hamadaea sp.]
MAAGRAALTSFVACAVLAGGNGVGIRFSNRELAPLWGATVRFGTAAVLLAIAMLVLRLPMPRGREWSGTVVYGLLNFAAAFGLGYYALQYLHAGFGQTLLALVPLVTLLLSVVEGQERLRPIAVFGTLLAATGVAILSRAQITGAIPLVALLAALGCTACFAQAAVLGHRLPSAHPVTTNAVAMAVGALALFAASLVAGEPRTLPQRTETWLALAFLVIVGSIGVFGLYLIVLRAWPASRAAYIFVITPFVTVALSAWLDQERVGWPLAAGGLLILAGVYFGVLRQTPAPVSSSRDESVLPDR